MLVLSRKVDESILIGDDIEIVLLRIQGGQCRVGIRAPRNVRISRSEIYEEFKGRHASASNGTPPCPGLGALESGSQAPGTDVY